MQHTLFAGCSYTAGSGFALEKADPALWVNRLYRDNIHLSTTEILNVGVGGRSNAGIFSDTIYNLLNYNCKYAFVAWTSSPRYEMELGLELYETRHVVAPNSRASRHALNDCVYDPAYLNNITNRLISLPHLHYEIKNLVYYVNSLVKLSRLTNTKLFFINALCNWDTEYFHKLELVMPTTYTKFTQQLINVANRDDNEIFQLYNKIHCEYNELGGIQSDHWINLYESMSSLKHDVNLDGVHPGTKSNQLYSQKFNKILQSFL
jgi:hypothetical protein